MNNTHWKDKSQKSYRQACPNSSGFHVSTISRNAFAHSMAFQQKAKHFGTLEMDKNVNNSVCRLPSFLFMVSIDSSRLSLSIGMFVDQKLSY